jgi:hypothetical protein
MSNLFQDVLDDAKGVEQQLLGSPYPYYKNIKLPNQIGMSDEGSLNALGKDINGLIQYVEVLVTGNSKASTTGGPLGNKFFLKTGAKCKDVKSSNQVDRYIYVDNVPAGNIPFISQGLGVNFTEFKGLIPGAMGNLNALNPFAISQAFLSGSVPDCQEITMETITTDNIKSSETNYVTLIDIKNMDPCIFANKTNPITNQVCRESFEPFELTLPTDPLVQIYYSSLAFIGLYILYKLMDK